MFNNSTTSPVLDCSDSPLSITGNVIGILTFVYAIFITLLYRSKTLIKAKDESKRFYIRAERMHSSLVEAQKRLEAYFSTLDLSMNPEIGLLLEDARYWAFQYKQGLLSKPGYKPTETERRRESIAMKGSYLFTKEDMDKVVEGMLQTRATLDGTYQVLLNSMIVDEVREQKTLFEVQSQSLSKQRAMILNIMGALNLEPPADSTSMDSPPKPELSQKKISINMSEMYLQPLGKENKKRPSQRSIEALRSERPPLCGCGQSYTSDQSGNPSWFNGGQFVATKINNGIGEIGEIFTWRTLARVHYDEGRWEEAEQLEMQVMETRKTKLGEDYPDTLASMANLALGL
ncbi:hypothetical protein N7478_013129 [Penicillium angulare]|uniref:uncharacterized protein n=1 Tax=Penicillium angulare TaxID=116970 RepID=UPI00254209A0|nr:uncharacterized protein N7478_013129 [Penicillium angulare]KAJ5257025.1 hypothetical protein N7478_013129 [Penicillium angulare]